MVCNKILTQHIFRKSLFSKNLRWLSSGNTVEKLDLKNMKVLENIADDWWDPKGRAQTLHLLNEVRVPFVRDGLISSGKISKNLQNSSDVLKGINILEVGCGGGILTEALGRMNGKITAIDPSPELIYCAQEHLKNKSAELIPNVTYFCEKIQDHANLNPNKYDAIVLSEVLEHVIDKELFLEASLQTLKQNGSIFVTTINKTISSYWVAIILAEKIYKKIPKNTHDWNHFITPKEVQRMLEKYGCQVGVVNGMGYEFKQNVWKRIDSTDGFYMLHAIKK